MTSPVAVDSASSETALPGGDFAEEAAVRKFRIAAADGKSYRSDKLAGRCESSREARAR